MRAEGEEVIQVKETDTTIEIWTGTVIASENETVIVVGPENGVIGVGMEEGRWMEGPGMEEMEAGIGTVTEVGLALLVGMGVGGIQEVLFDHISVYEVLIWNEVVLFLMLWES